VFPEEASSAGSTDHGGIKRTDSVVSVSSQSHLLGPGSAAQPPDSAPEDGKDHRGRKEVRHIAWAHDREVMLSELVFKVDMFCKTTIYELLPLPIAIAVCTLVDGWQIARNRFSAVFCCIVLPVFDLGWQSIIAYTLYFRFSDVLSRSAGYEVLGFVFLPSLARAMTLGIKYALYSDLLLSVDPHLSLGSREYEKKGYVCVCVCDVRVRVRVWASTRLSPSLVLSHSLSLSLSLPFSLYLYLYLYLSLSRARALSASLCVRVCVSLSLSLSHCFLTKSFS
jgi:hypothetical protein